MMADNLAPVYLDDARVTLQGDPRPKVAKILQAGGKSSAEGVVVVRLREAAGADGQPIALDEVVDREEAATPVYLRVVNPARTEQMGPVRRSPPRGVPAPGDITRGTEAVSPGTSGEEAARVGRTESQRFAESQSFADPAHRGGSPRVAQGARPSRAAPPERAGEETLRSQQTGNEGGSKAAGRPRNTTTSTRESLERASEEE
jgi:hypothetical protein